LNIAHTSATEHGLIYISQVNWALMICTIGLVLGFRSSSNLAAAHGIAVGATMVVTTMLTYLVARGSWGASRWSAGSLALVFLVIELGLFGSNLPKIPHGGWFPLAVATVAHIGMTTWKKGRTLLGRRLAERMYPPDRFMKDMAERPPHCVSGTAVFMTSSLQGTPPILLHNLRHNKVLHQRILLLTAVTLDSPFVAGPDRVEIDRLGDGFYRITIRYGFMEEPNVPAALSATSAPQFRISL